MVLSFLSRHLRNPRQTTRTTTATALLALSCLSTLPQSSNSMTWTATWDDILRGGPTRWKVDDLKPKQQALSYITKYHVGGSDGSDGTKLNILCPLAGDDPFVQYAWSRGHSVTAIDLVPAAVQVMKEQFGGSEMDWKKESSANDSEVIWRHQSGRATLYQGDMMAKRAELLNHFDAIYDKDSFGALPMELRETYCQRLADYAKDDSNSIVYIEVKNKETGRESGPPYHVDRADLMESFGQSFVHMAELGQVYPLPMPNFSQMGHILQRKSAEESS
mmetsp:Transcript_21534/g.46690  ORF Transcript_21534/g.46690 Transcript_21534/m.46690 type:complete len:276 (+) Transcript_21534:50-877(+)